MQRREVLGQSQRVPLGDDVEHRPDADAAGALGEERAEQDAVRDDLVALVLEVVLGQPVAVVAELLGPHAHVEQPLLCVPEVLLLVPPTHRCRGPGPGIVDLDATEEEDPYTHASIMAASSGSGEPVHDDLGQLLALVLLKEVAAALDGGVGLTLRARHT